MTFLKISRILLLSVDNATRRLINYPQVYFTFMILDDLDSSLCRALVEKFFKFCSKKKIVVLKRTEGRTLSGTVH